MSQHRFATYSCFYFQGKYDKTFVSNAPGYLNNTSVIDTVKMPRSNSLSSSLLCKVKFEKPLTIVAASLNSFNKHRVDAGVLDFARIQEMIDINQSKRKWSGFPVQSSIVDLIKTPHRLDVLHRDSETSHQKVKKKKKAIGNIR